MRLKQTLAALLIVSTTHVGFVQTAQAAMIGTEQVAQASTAPPADDARSQLSEAFARADVQARLQALGVDSQRRPRARRRPHRRRALRLAGEIDKAPAGGIIEVILFVFFVLLVTDILGFTKVFPFTRSIR